MPEAIVGGFEPGFRQFKKKLWIPYSAAILAFLEMPVEVREEYAARIQKAESFGKTEALVKKAIDGVLMREVADALAPDYRLTVISTPQPKGEAAQILPPKPGQPAVPPVPAGGGRGRRGQSR